MTTTAEKVAGNAILTMIARGALALIALAFIPAVVALFNMSSSIDRLAASNAQLKTELVAKIDQTEARINLRLAPLEDRQGTQSAWMRQAEVRLDTLTDRVTQITVQVAVLVEKNSALIDKIKDLIDLNKAQPQGPVPPGRPR